MVDRAKAVKVLNKNKTAKAIDYIKMGKIHRAHAGKIVISAGGVGTPSILRSSGIKNTGYNFFFDPLSIFSRLV